MKIVIVHKTLNEKGREYAVADGVWIIDSLQDLQLMTYKYPNEDIKGIIMPDAHNNPEFPDIIREIYEHKKRIYQKTTTDYQSGPLPHYIFLKTMEKHYGNDVLRTTSHIIFPLKNSAQK